MPNTYDTDREELDLLDYEDIAVAAVHSYGEGSWEIKLDNGVSFGFAKHGVEPKPGDMARLHPRASLGTEVRGLALNGTYVFYRTREQEAARRQAKIAEMKDEKRASYLLHRDEYEAQLAALPEQFQKRIAGFRDANPEFWENEPYELFACTEAVKIAAKVKVEDLSAFQKLPFEQQKVLVPDLSDAHSGNTFGAACHLASVYLAQPELLASAHGALCPLVGCKKYGCAAARPAPPVQSEGEYVQVWVKKLRPEALIPKYATEGSACMDVHACLPDTQMVIRPGQRALIPTGLAFALPPEHEMQIRPRSGLALKHGITVANSPGTLDADFRGELQIILHNTHVSTDPGWSPVNANGERDDGRFVVNHGDRIAQIVVKPVPRIELLHVKELPSTARGAGGFGSTGV